MKKGSSIILAAALLPTFAMAQSAFEAEQLSQNDFKGSARFMSMGGAFTALGGDLSTLNQNPAGIGLYRSTEIGVTLDINMQRTSTNPFNPDLYPNSMKQTKVYCNNFGFVSSVKLDGVMRTLNFGVSYNRAASFDRIYTGSMANIGTSLTNYIADYSTSAGYTPKDLGFDDLNKNYDPYWDSSADWLAILAYNSYMINPTGPKSWKGLYNYSNSFADAAFSVRETGHNDIYNLSVGGNVENTVYWGLSVGISDLRYTRSLYYAENVYDGDVVAPASATSTTNGDGYTELNAFKNVRGTGFNLKLGVIVKPINELRIGLAIHTPTWYRLSEDYDGSVNYKYMPVSYTPSGDPIIDESKINQGDSGSPVGDFRWRLNSPWKLMVGVAGVLGTQAIVSVDYQFDGYNSMKTYAPNNIGGYTAYDDVNNDISNYFKGTHTFRIGAEYRVSPQFSVRAGYNFSTSNVRDMLKNAIGPNNCYYEAITDTLDPSYTLNNTSQNITCGLGYRYRAWYIDAAYVYNKRDSQFHAFTNYSDVLAPQSKITDNNHSLVFSTGFKF